MKLEDYQKEAETIRDIILAVLDANDYLDSSSNRSVKVGSTFSGGKTFEHPCGGSIVIRSDTHYKWSMENARCIFSSKHATMFTTDSNVLFNSMIVRDEMPLLENITEETLFQLSLIHDPEILHGLVITSLLRTMDLPSFGITPQAMVHGVERWTSEWMSTQGPKWI